MLKELDDDESFERILEKEMTQQYSGHSKKKTFTLDEFDEEDLKDDTKDNNEETSMN